MTKENVHTHDENCKHLEEPQTLKLTLDDGNEMECVIIDLFDIDEQTYIALLHPVEETALLYRFKELSEGSIDLTNIESDEEFEKVSDALDYIKSQKN